jgi:tetrapyrrole methylase
MLEMSKKDAVKLLSKELGINKNRVYDLSLNL